MNAADMPPQAQQTMQLSEQDVNYVVQALGQRPLIEALPLWLKLTGQQLVPTVRAAPEPAQPPA